MDLHSSFMLKAVLNDCKTCAIMHSALSEPRPENGNLKLVILPFLGHFLGYLSQGRHLSKTDTYSDTDCSSKNLVDLLWLVSLASSLQFSSAIYATVHSYKEHGLPVHSA